MLQVYTVQYCTALTQFCTYFELCVTWEVACSIKEKDLLLFLLSFCLNDRRTRGADHKERKDTGKRKRKATSSYDSLRASPTTVLGTKKEPPSPFIHTLKVSVYVCRLPAGCTHLLAGRVCVVGGSFVRIRQKKKWRQGLKTFPFSRSLNERKTGREESLITEWGNF